LVGVVFQTLTTYRKSGRLLILRVMAFHEKAGRSQVDSCLGFVEQGFLPPSGRCRHASIRTREERSFRSVQVGRSRFSRCCHLIIDLLSHRKDESWTWPLTQSPELGFGLLLFLFPGTVLTWFAFLVLRGCGRCRLIAVFIAGLLFICASSTSITWERTPHPARRPAFSSHLITTVGLLSVLPRRKCRSWFYRYANSLAWVC
jgi:hypothetical protein